MCRSGGGLRLSLQHNCIRMIISGFCRMTKELTVLSVRFAGAGFNSVTPVLDSFGYCSFTPIFLTTLCLVAYEQYPRFQEVLGLSFEY